MPWKPFEETIRRGQSRSIKAYCATDDDDDECNEISFYINAVKAT